jgi:sec-independent protein translocase protein TatB
MFDVSFTEMLVIAVVALVVIGPERLPKVARTVGHLLGRAQRYVSDVKGDIRREMELDELRNLRTEMEEAARTIKSTVDTNVEEMRKELDHTTREVKSLADDAAQSASTASAAADVAVHGGDAVFLPEGAAGAASAAGVSPHADPAHAAPASSVAAHTHDSAAAHVPELVPVPNPAITPRDLPAGAPMVTPDPVVTVASAQVMPQPAPQSAPQPALQPAAAPLSGAAPVAGQPSVDDGDGAPVPQASLFPTDVLPPAVPPVASVDPAADTHPAAALPARDREKA